jgi:hypothetical protein
MKTIGKSDHARRGAAPRAAGIRQSPGLTHSEAMHTLAGSRHVRMPADCYATHWQGASLRICAPGD